MTQFRQPTFGEYVFSKIDRNEYLQKLYHNILFNYSRRLFQLENIQEKPVDIDDALSFADILSKSTGTSFSDTHKIRAQEMMALLYDMYPDNDDIKYCLGAVLANTGNYLGLNRMMPQFESASVMEKLFMYCNMNYLSIPTDKNEHFFPAQKNIYDSLSKQYYSFSAPTSMGKTFLMRSFIRQQIEAGVKKNFAVLLPTKALINEVTHDISEELGDGLSQHGYGIITSSGSVALGHRDNYIFVLTPERMLYILIDDPELTVDYLFIDEAHKISSGDRRSSIYHMVIELLKERKSAPNVIFASPHIPNPDIFLDVLMIPEIVYQEENRYACRYAPVSQVKYVVDLYERKIRIFDGYSKKFIDFYDMYQRHTLSDIILRIGDRKHNIVYCKSKNDAIQFARDYADRINPSHDKKLQAFADAIKKDVHGEYYLAELVEKGVAYHIGYLPANIRMQLEDYYRDGLIKTLFCTSTLLEGVNLPAENLFITSYKKGTSKFSEVDFRNLMGRVGRAKYNLYGNVFVTRLPNQANDEDIKKYEDLLKDDIPPQKLSIETELNSNQKKLIVDTLKSGNVEIRRSKKDQSEDNYDLMRKTMLTLLSDLLRGRNSRVRREFDEYLSDEAVATIRKKFSDPEKQQSDDINISYDQIKGIRKKIQEGLKYPDIDPVRGADYDETLEFLTQLARAFKWRIYEKRTLGAGEGRNYTKLRWYTVLLTQWMQGHGLGFIIYKTIEDFDAKKRNVWINNHETERYDGSQRHKNFIIADSLEAIDDVLLFRLSNYFLKFSQEYKLQHPNEPFNNDWYEFVEYGTTNRLRIILQRSGFKRESTAYIMDHSADYVRGTADDPKLLRTIKDCPNDLVRRDYEEIQYNVPELFVTEGED